MQVVRESRVVHGYRRSWLRAGAGPALVLVHGVGDRAETWREVIPPLARTHTVIAPDLLGHGESDKPRADYSIGGFANGVRDLLMLLRLERATLVGHSLGGGVALQFAYQYPERCDRLVLEASGGLGADVTPVLRVASVPGAAYGIALTSRAPLRRPTLLVLGAMARAGLLDPTDVTEAGHVWSGLQQAETRRAFLRTLRAVVDVRGQAVSSRDRLYLTGRMPTLMVWGERDPVLPVRHAREVSRELPDVGLAVLPRAGHVPHRSEPEAFVRVLQDFLTGTRPSAHDPDAWRALLTSGAAPVGTRTGLHAVP